jgi:hypothetical protein
MATGAACLSSWASAWRRELQPERPCLPGVRSLDLLVGVAYSREVTWVIELTRQVEDWLLKDLDVAGRSKIVPAIDELERQGPTLGRPLVDRIKGSRHHNMKEMRSIGGNIRVLFAFDPERNAILLIGGDKTGDWKSWYGENIPIADKLYDDHLEKKI